MPFLRYFFLLCLMATLLVIGWAGLRGSTSTRPPLEIFPDMDNQAKVKYQAQSAFFADGRGERRPIPGTLPMGLSVATQPAPDRDKSGGAGFSIGSDYYRTGRFGDYWGDGLPEQVNIDPALIRRGAERFNIYCSPCHGYSGDGNGVTAKYGVPTAAGNFHLPTFTDPKDANYRTDGNIFATITYGKGQMGPYGAVIQVPDRWAIIAYIRTLQMAKRSVAPATAATPPAPTPTPTPTPPPPAPGATAPPAPAPPGGTVPEPAQPRPEKK
jgi:mono/diheme cytochrome c family protein